MHLEVHRPVAVGQDVMLSVVVAHMNAVERLVEEIDDGAAVEAKLLRIERVLQRGLGALEQ
jgi:hypothetical protein